MANRLRDQAKTFLAWQSIVADITNEKLNLDLFQVKQAKRHKEGAEQALNQMIRETYKWLIAPTEGFVAGKPQLNWEVTAVSTTAPNLIQEIENRLREEEWLIYEWSPIHLMNLLQRWYFKDGIHEVSALKVWQDCCHYLYLPRLVKDDVFKNAINLDPVRAKMNFATIVDEVVEQFTSKLGVDVNCSIEIQATSTRDGFDDALQR